MTWGDVFGLLGIQGWHVAVGTAALVLGGIAITLTARFIRITNRDCRLPDDFEVF